MVEYRNECVGCAPDFGGRCLGSSCPNRNVKYLVCDKCDCAADKLYIYDSGMELCEECLLESFETIED